MKTAIIVALFVLAMGVIATFGCYFWILREHEELGAVWAGTCFIAALAAHVSSGSRND